MEEEETSVGMQSNQRCDGGVPCWEDRRASRREIGEEGRGKGGVREREIIEE